MPTTIMKLVSIAVLLGAIFWRPYGGYQLLFEFAVFAGAILVIAQSYRLDKFRWGFVFVVIATLFNPVSPLAFPRIASLLLNATCLALFAMSLFVLKAQPRLSIASITDRTPGSLSL